MEIVWRGLQNPSTERLQLTEGAGVSVRSTVVDADRRFDYEVELDTAWVFQTLRVRSTGGIGLDLIRTADGQWSLDGLPRPDLDAAVDIDLAFSPFTNTLPIRRLPLEVGEAVEIVTAYVSAPTLDATPDPQRYTRIAKHRFLHESLDSDFRREITVDGDGFVVEYPGLFARSTGKKHPGAG